MIRSWIGFVLLVVLLAGCILVTWAMDRIHRPLEAQLLQAAQEAMEDNWDQAGEIFREAWYQWETTGNFRSCFADHTPVEDIDADFEMLLVCCAARETISFAGGCRQLARQIAAVGEAHTLVWWNLL